MKTALLLPICFLALFFFVLSTEPAQAMNPRVGARRAYSSIVQVIVDTRFGTTRRVTGYRFNRGNVILPYHAVTDAVRMRILHADFGIVEVTRFETVDPDMDVAVIYSAAMYSLELDGLQYGDTHTMAPGLPISIYSHASYQEYAVSPGEILELTFPKGYERNHFTAEIRQEQSFIHFRGYVDAGSAGGILVSEDFEVLGMILGTDGHGGGYAMRAEDMHSLQVSSGIFDWSSVETHARSDEEIANRWCGPFPEKVDVQVPISGGYMMWYSPIYEPRYANPEFTEEIHDKIQGNWFHNQEIVLDSQPLRRYSASRIFTWDANDNPWEMHDSEETYVHFDADSLFKKRVYRNLETEERIMTKQILCMPLTTGEHTVTYQNKMANYNDSGMKRKRFNIELGIIQSLDVNGLSLVSMKFIDNPEAAVSQRMGLRYELQRRPLSDNDVGIALRSARFQLSP